MSNMLTKEQAFEIITPFYNLFCSDRRDWDLGFGVLDDDWKSYYTNDKYRTKSDTRPYIAGLFEIVPDINVEILDFFVSGDQVAVRSELSGTPNTDFMVPHSGRKFSIMTIDIHKISNGKIVELRHLEDWGTAIRQLSGQE
ncbi:MAG: ester cyclase [Candidatus Kapabacteria bacterium]|nr:ester cyclase [Ignavibacteriota bacterium]MCW5885277.1 ester cyclase [Candidatus Kapabacteria bacterium]